MSDSSKTDVRLHFNKGEIVLFDCGHKGPIMYTLLVRDKVVSPPESNRMAKCGQCHVEHLRSTVIRCAKCGAVILPGELVRFWLDADMADSPYRHRGKQVLFPANQHGGARTGFVGCMTLSCCLDGCSFAGKWDGTNIISGSEGADHDKIRAFGLPMPPSSPHLSDPSIGPDAPTPIFPHRTLPKN